MRTSLLARAAALVALAAGACTRSAEQPSGRGAAISTTALPGTVAPSPAAPAELTLPAGDSAIDVAPSPFGPDVAIVVRHGGRARLDLWHVGSDEAATVTELPDGFVPRAVAAHPAALTFFVSGSSGTTSRILAVTDIGGTPKTTTILSTPNEVGHLIVGSRPFAGDSGQLYRIFFAARLSTGETSLRSITERGGIEYQVVGPASAAVAYPDIPPGGITARFGVPMSTHPRGEPLLWQDQNGCVHAYHYDGQWQNDTTLRALPCEGTTVFAPNGNAYLHWTPGRPGITVIGAGVTTPVQAPGYTFAAAPVSVADGRGVIGVVVKPSGASSVAYVPIVVPLADVANAWQEATDDCHLDLLAREGGSFDDHDSTARELYTIYDERNYLGGPHTPALATTDLFWENFGAAYNGVFILAESHRAAPAFWAFVDSANAALAASAPTSKWAQAFAAIAASRAPGAAGEGGLIARATDAQPSAVLGEPFDFAELKPRGHYTSSAEMQQYFRAMHYLTQVAAIIDSEPSAAAQLAALPANVQRSAARWIDVYAPFIAPPRAQLVWSGTATPPLAHWAKHPSTLHSVFPLSWGLDNEALESTVFHEKWPPDEQIVSPDSVRRLHPTGLDVAAAFGGGYARALLAPDLQRYPRLAPVLDAIHARRPAITDRSSLYERWLDALGTEWADSSRFPGVPATSKLWDAKRLQTGLASWATLREATILVNERAGAAEAGEGGFEQLIYETPRGYVEPSPNAFRAIASLYTSLSRSVALSSGFEPFLRDAVVTHLDSSAAEALRFAAMADHELHGQALTDSDYAAIQDVGGSAEHAFLIYKSLGDTTGGIAIPDPVAKIADVAGDQRLGILEVAVGNPIEWRQVVPFFGRREVTVGGAYSYYEALAHEPHDNAQWRREVASQPHPAWVQPYVVPKSGCRAAR